MLELVKVIKERNIKSIAIPPLGAGNGGLEWGKVKLMIEDYLKDLDCTVYLYQPNYEINEILKKERVALTPARAMLLSVLFELVRNGEFVSEFAAEKIAYFLQRFGAASVFNLDYQPHYYGPYSGRVKHVLYYLNGSYLTGYSSKDKKPFDELGLMMDAEPDVNAYLEKPENIGFKTIANNTKDFLSGFYSYLSLELLSTIDYIIQTEKVNTPIEIQEKLNSWSDRKKTLFSNPKFLTIAIGHLEGSGLVGGC